RTGEGPDWRRWMVGLGWREKPTREKISSGDLPPNARRMKNSGMTRPEVEARDPKLNDFPAISFGKSAVAASPVLALAMNRLLKFTSSAPCAIASDPAAPLRA